MKLAIKILKKALASQQDDLEVNQRMLRDKSHTMGDYFKDEIETNKKTIESLRKAIAVLKIENKN